MFQTNRPAPASRRGGFRFQTLRSGLLVAAALGCLPEGLQLSARAQAFQDRFVTSPGMPRSSTSNLEIGDIALDWGLAMDLRSPISLSGPGRSGEIDGGLRVFDLGLAGTINRDLWAFALVEGNSDELSLQHAALVYEGLSSSSYLRLGVLPLDFGKQMQARPYELPYPERPGVLRAYLGDQVLGTGISYGDVFATGDHSTVRTSLGLFTQTERRESSLDGRALSLPGLEVTDGPRMHELAINARLTGLMDVGPEGVLQWGFSAHSMPDFSVALTANDGTDLAAQHLDHWVYGMDFSFGWSDETEGPSWSAGWEGLIADGQVGARALGAGPATLEIFEDRVYGHYLWLERQTRSGRALGLLYSDFERTMPGTPQEREVSLYFSRPLGDRSTLRFQLSHRDAQGERASERALVQWTAQIGRLGHAVDW
ncbi:MAG: hypothetical protein P1V35_04965 [Planctomycetota bacterium]|nr:hypothetical protein [Planctomycetota bacterium]